MSEVLSVRKFKQVDRKRDHEYISEEIHFETLESGFVRTVYVAPSGERKVGPTVSAKIHEKNLSGFDIITKRGERSHTERFIGMLECNCFKEIID
jgi:hypothetical protein